MLLLKRMFAWLSFEEAREDEAESADCHFVLQMRQQMPQEPFGLVVELLVDEMMLAMRKLLKWKKNQNQKQKQKLAVEFLLSSSLLPAVVIAIAVIAVEAAIAAECGRWSGICSSPSPACSYFLLSDGANRRLL